VVICPAAACTSCHCASHSPMLFDVGSPSGMRASVTAHVRPLTRLCVGQAASAPAPFTHQATRAPAPFTHQAKAAWAATVPAQVSPAQGGDRCCAQNKSDLLVRPAPPSSPTPTLTLDLPSYPAPGLAAREHTSLPGARKRVASIDRCCRCYATYKVVHTELGSCSDQGYRIAIKTSTESAPLPCERRCALCCVRSLALLQALCRETNVALRPAVLCEPTCLGLLNQARSCQESAVRRLLIYRKRHIPCKPKLHVLGCAARAPWTTRKRSTCAKPPPRVTSQRSAPALPPGRPRRRSPLRCGPCPADAPRSTCAELAPSFCQDHLWSVCELQQSLARRLTLPHEEPSLPSWSRSVSPTQHLALFVLGRETTPVGSRFRQPVQLQDARCPTYP